jgi:hypothetical protein
VNRSVATVTCRQHGELFTSELAEVFPNADKLQVVFPVRDSVVAEVDVRDFLEYILDTCPTLVERVAAVDLELGSAAPTEGTAGAAARFLAFQVQPPVTWLAHYVQCFGGHQLPLHRVVQKLLAHGLDQPAELLASNS